MPDKRQIIPAGTVFNVTDGEYSDFGIMGTYRALREIDVDAAKIAVETAATPEARRNATSYARFLRHLEESGLAEPISDVMELHLGGYGDLNPTTHP